MKSPAILESIDELASLYKQNKHIICAFYQLNNVLEPEALRRKAITGSTFRAFHINKKTSGSGMSFYFTKTIERYILKNPTLHSVQSNFITDLSQITNGKFNNWHPDDNGMPKLMKLYNLYANYWVAYNLAGQFNQKLSSIRKLNVPLDKYSLTFISDLYNFSRRSSEKKLKGYLSMGKVIEMEQYNIINSFITKLASDVTQMLGEEFCPIYLDIIQASQNKLGWYTNNIN